MTPADLEFKTPRTTFEVVVVDGGAETSVDRQGHGFQRTLLISALQLLAEAGAAANEGFICLAIEEPELFQHPVQARTFAKVLRGLAEDPSQRMQITYATHSPYFVEPRCFHQVRRLVRSSTGGPTVRVFASTLVQVQANLAGVLQPDKVERQLDGTAIGQLADALFAAAALIVEGTTEEAVIYGICDREEIGWLQAKGVSIVPAGGKGGIPLAHAICASLGIPTYVLFDGDAHCKDTDRPGHVTQNRRLLKYFGLPAEDFPADTVTDSVAILNEDLESLLGRQWPEWMVARTEHEERTQTSLAKNQSAYRAVTLASDGEPPEMLLRVIGEVRRTLDFDGGSTSRDT